MSRFRQIVEEILSSKDQPIFYDSVRDIVSSLLSYFEIDQSDIAEEYWRDTGSFWLVLSIKHEPPYYKEEVLRLKTRISEINNYFKGMLQISLKKSKNQNVYEYINYEIDIIFHEGVDTDDIIGLLRLKGLWRP